MQHKKNDVKCEERRRRRKVGNKRKIFIQLRPYVHKIMHGKGGKVAMKERKERERKKTRKKVTLDYEFS